jgi:hypothetical protein
MLVSEDLKVTEANTSTPRRDVDKDLRPKKTQRQRPLPQEDSEMKTSVPRRLRDEDLRAKRTW